MDTILNKLQRHAGVGACLSGDSHWAQQTMDEAKAEIERRGAALGRYGTHLPDCKMQNFRDESDCTCGWRDVECSIHQQNGEVEK